MLNKSAKKNDSVLFSSGISAYRGFPVTGNNQLDELILILSPSDVVIKP